MQRVKGGASAVHAAQRSRPCGVGALRDAVRRLRFELAGAMDFSTRAQVLTNLLGNAAKFTRSGRVRLVARRADDAIEIIVRDTGPGIEVGFTPRATEPFVRGEHPGAGAGLGLAIVSRLLRVLGGTLAIDSAPGRGTKVSVTLPAAPAIETALGSSAVA